MHLPIFWKLEHLLSKTWIFTFQNLDHHLLSMRDGFPTSLSFVVRSCLAQTGINTMSNFIMSYFSIPRKVIKGINWSQAKVWGVKKVDKFCRLIKWDTVCKPEASGGVGISNLSNMNLALVTKLAWRTIS